MVQLMMQFFGIVGTDLTPPTTFATLLPWLFQVSFGIGIVALIIRGFFVVVRSLTGGRLF